MAVSSLSELTLDSDQRQQVMSALLIGLESFGEIERLRNAAKLIEFDGAIPERFNDLRPFSPGDADTVSLFAEALRYINRS